MIAVVISEKGGAERRESYDQNEITIGRVKGNDILLPKGNVSKRHARLIVRDGRYIVTDLKSTNGTYVNHRRITHATLVREGDRIYIGDFVLRIEGGDLSRSSQHSRDSVELPPLEDSSASSDSHVSLSVSAAPEGSLSPHSPHEVVSHFPIEHDPDDSSPSLEVPAPPRVPSGLRRGSQTSSSPVHSSNSPPATSELPGDHSGREAGSTLGSGHRPSSLPEDETRKLAFDQAVRVVLEAVEARLEEDILSELKPDHALTEKIDSALDVVVEEAGSGFPTAVDRADVRAAARLELVELGPLGALIEDAGVTKILLLGRHLTAERRGQRIQPHPGFGTDAGVVRSLRRLAQRFGEALPEGDEASCELGSDHRLFIVRPPLAGEATMVVIERRSMPESSLDGLVRKGAISRGMATLLAHCAGSRANVLVTDIDGGGAQELMTALVGACRKASLLWLTTDRAPAPGDVTQVPLASDEEGTSRALAAALRLRSDHLILPPLHRLGLVAALDAIADGAQGVIMRSTSNNLQQALARLAAEVAGARSGVSVPTAREWVGASFDLGLEVTRLRDGRLRVVRVAEFRATSQGVGLRDIFTFTYHHTAAGGSVEGSFYASGTIPRIIEDLAARGMPLDTSIFRRHPGS